MLSRPPSLLDFYCWKVTIYKIVISDPLLFMIFICLFHPLEKEKFFIYLWCSFNYICFATQKKEKKFYSWKKHSSQFLPHVIFSNIYIYIDISLDNFFLKQIGICFSSMLRVDSHYRRYRVCWNALRSFKI